MGLNVIPYAGIQTFVFGFKLLIMERRDDFQCINFIDSFKGLQFLQGLIFVVRGVMQYLQCAGLETVEHGHTCDYDGPGVLKTTFFLSQRGAYIISLFEFLMKIMITYLGFYFLSKSVSLGGKIFIDHRLEGAAISLFESLDKKTRSKVDIDLNKEPVYHNIFQVETMKTKINYIEAQIDEYNPKTGFHSLIYADEKKRCLENDDFNFPRHIHNLEVETFKMLSLPGTKANIMRFLLKYDIFLFILCFGCSSMITVLWANEDGWMIMGAFWWAKVFYQLFSFPFLILKIPGIKVLLTHARMTGYKPNGTLVIHKKRTRDDKMKRQQRERKLKMEREERGEIRKNEKKRFFVYGGGDSDEEHE